MFGKQIQSYNRRNHVLQTFSAKRFPKATLSKDRWTISSSDRSASPIERMQWWIRPGPKRPWAISNPRPSPVMKQKQQE